MSDDLDVLGLLHTEPAPAMRVDLDAVVAEGRRRHTRRTTRWVAASAAAVAAVAVAAVVLQPPGPGRTAPPAGDSRTLPGQTAGPVRTHQVGVDWEPEQPDASGAATLTAPGASYAVSVARGVLS